MGLTACFRKSNNLDQDDFKNIRDIANAYKVEDGLTEKDAVLRSINDFVESELSDYKDIYELITEKGGIVPTADELRKQYLVEQKIQEPTLNKDKNPKKDKIDDLGEKIGGARKDTANKLGKRNKTEGKLKGWRKQFVVVENLLNGGGSWNIFNSRTGKTVRGSNYQSMSFETEEMAQSMLAKAAVSEKHFVRGDGGKGFTIWRRVGDRKTVRVVADSFETYENGIAYLFENAEEILDTKLNFGEEVLPTPEKVYREGESRRDGDIEGKDFMNTFGFRGVEFGKWNNQEERQEVMNHAYDALLDMSEIIGVPAKALSLNGELALAFGARGQGLTGAKAHYEPKHAVINLTKMSGAGSLAHEWLHSLDHYFGRIDGKAASKMIENEKGNKVFEIKNIENVLASHGFKYNSNARPELKEAYIKLIKTMFTKAETYVEDTIAAERWLGSARDELKTNIDRLLNRLAEQLNPQWYKRNNKPANIEQLTRFDELADMLINGEASETELRLNENKRTRYPGFRNSNDVLDEMAAIYKKVRGRAGFKADKGGVIDRLSAKVGFYHSRITTLNEAKDESPKVKSVVTSFAMQAKSADQARASDYWSSPHEMAARAFAAYVEDKLIEKNASNDFLAYHAHGAILVPVYPEGLFRPYPEGKERKAVNKAFDNLFDVIETKETDKGVAMFNLDPDEAPKSVSGVDRGQVEKITSEFLNDLNLKKDIDVKIYDQWQDLIADLKVSEKDAKRALGFIKGDALYLIAGNLRSSDEIKPLLRHEILAHYGLDTLDPADKLAVLKKITASRYIPFVRQYWNEVSKTYGHKYKNRPLKTAEEVFARIAEEDPSDPPKAWNQIVDIIIKGLRKIGFLKNTITHSESRALLKSIAKGIKSGSEKGSSSNEIKAMLGNSTEESELSVADMWREVVKKDDVFQYEISEAKDWDTLMKDVSAGDIYRIKSMPDAYKLYSAAAEDSGRKLKKVTSATILIRGKDGDPSGARKFDIMENDKEVWINVSGLKKGSGGSAVYNLVSNYAYNNNKVFIGDPSGLSPAAFHRRLENMISSALKFGTTKHLKPHPYQEGKFESEAGINADTFETTGFLDWIEGDHVGNLEKMLELSYNNAYEFIPALKDYRFDPGAQQFRSQSSGAVLTNKRLRRLGERPGSRTINAGSTTIKRALLTKFFRTAKETPRQYIDAWLAKYADEQIPQQLNDTLYSLRPEEESNTNSAIWSNINDRLDSFRYMFQDKHIDLKRKQQKVAGDLGNHSLDDSINAYQKISIWESKAGEKLHVFDEQTIQPLIQRIADSGHNLSEVGEWLVARHAKEANAYLAKINPDKPAEERNRLSGMSNDEASKILSKHTNDSELQSIGKEIDRINKANLDTAVKHGLITSNLRDTLQKTYKHYVPLKREEASEKGGFTSRGQGFHIKGRESKLRKGNAYWNPANIVANVLAQSETTIVRAEKNEVGKALLGFANENPDEKFWRIESNPKMTAVVNGKVQEIADNFNADNRLTVKVDGEETHIVFNERNDKAMRLVAGMKNLSVKEMNTVFSILSNINRFLSSINTTFNPEFVISNFFRDLQTGAYNLSDTKLKNMQMKVLKDIPSAMNGIRSSLFGDGSAKWSSNWEDFRTHGGKTGWIDVHSDIKRYEKSLDQAINRLKEGKGSKPEYLKALDAVENANTVIENAVRLSAYKNALDAGLTKDQAASLAKDLTVNFNRKGSAGPAMNALYMFANASMQGSVRMLQAMIHSDKGRKMAMATVAFAVMLDVINRSISGDDEDDENSYDSLPDFVKNHNLIIMGEHEPLVKIPLPYGYNVLHSIGQSIGRVLTGQHVKILDEAAKVAGSALDAFNPVGNGTPLQTISPTITDPLVMMSENKNFAGMPLKPEHTFDARTPKPEYLMHWKSATDSSKDIAKFLNDMSGGNSRRPGELNVSPETLDLAYEQYLGGLGGFLKRTYIFGEKIANGDDITRSDVPFVRKLTGYKNDYGVKARYYDWSKNVAYSKSELKYLNGDELTDAKKRPEAKLVSLYKSTERRLRGLRKRRRAYVKNNKLDKIKDIDMNIQKAMAKFNRAYVSKVLN